MSANDNQTLLAEHDPLGTQTEQSLDYRHHIQCHQQRIESQLLSPFQATAQMIRINLAYLVGFLRQARIEFFAD